MEVWWERSEAENGTCRIKEIRKETGVVGFPRSSIFPLSSPFPFTPLFFKPNPDTSSNTVDTDGVNVEVPVRYYVIPLKAWNFLLKICGAAKPPRV